MNITEDFCSVDVAKLLEEKGFPIWEFHKDAIGVFNGIAVSSITKELIKERVLSCIPHSVAMKYLRVVHNIFIQIELYSKHGDYCFEVFKNTHRLVVEKDEVYNTPEEACEDALKYVLENLI